MYLKSLEIAGFKSFAKKSQLDFKTPVTAIVGPNGSGKSNVAEAFRFVLGEQSMKSMRGKRGEDLIWNGSQEQPRAGRAVVKSVFDNTKRIFTSVDFDEVVIERIVNRDGTNEYLVNGTQVRLKDVLGLLAEAHIGASGHHIISQGEADRILSANIKERRMMVEDALGLKVYQYKRLESQKKMQKTVENIGQVKSLRAEIAPHLRFLQRQVEKMSKATEVRGKLVGLYKEYLKREKIFLDNEKNNLKTERHPLEIEKGDLERKMERARETLKNSGQKDGRSDELLEMEAKIRKEREEKDFLAREAGKLEGEIGANERAAEKMARKIQEGENTMISWKEVEKLAEEIKTEANRASYESVLEKLKDIVHSISTKIEEFVSSRRVKTEEGSVEEIQKQVKDLRKKKEDVENNIQQKSESLKSLEDSYESLKKSIEAEKDSSREAEKEMLKLSSEETVNRSKLESLRMREENLRALEQEFLREAEEAGALLGSLILGFADLELQNLAEARNVQEERRRDLERMKIRLEELGAGGGEEVLKEYNDAKERDAFLEKELSDLNASLDSLNQLIAELEERLNTEFKQGIEKINKEFQNFFTLMFGGGSATLEVIENSKFKIKNSEEDLEGEEPEEAEAGIEINVSLPKKRIRGLNMLSGGERALTSIALLFAISAVNPPPFIILDETDAALDEANSKKYGDMIQSLSKYSELILITHNRETMSRAGVIYGVTMGSSGASRLLSIAFDEAVSVAK